jgi:hypothetical protein
MPRIARIPLAIAGALVPLATLAACSSASVRTAATGRPAGQPAAAPAAVAGAAATPSQPCGAQAAETLARTAGVVASRIYRNELTSSEVVSDRHQVEGYKPLLNALEGGDRTALKEAVSSLVYSHTHIVRLRVTRGNAVLADVGGPQILAPVEGTLREHGRTLGRYALSVQDDLGYVKLVTRFIGVPMVLSSGTHVLAVEGALDPGPSPIPAHGPVSYRGASYQAFSFTARAFPSGSLRISLMVPVTASLSRQACADIKVAELGRVAERISRRFHLSASTYPSYIQTTTSLTGGLIYIRAGSHQLAGSRPGPSRLPAHGTVSYRGASYGVFSFTAPSEAGQVRIYQLVRQ